MAPVPTIKCPHCGKESVINLTDADLIMFLATKLNVKVTIDRV